MRAMAAAKAMLAQALPGEWSLELIIVDDGSGDGTAAELANFADPRVNVIALPENVGRSAARNAGARDSRGSVLIFMDCDCLPCDDYFVAAHVTTLSHSVASTGRIVGSGTGFWDRYQCEASMQRERHHGAGMTYVGSSSNLAIRIAAFKAIGGFDTVYRTYGFEDRDLLIRLARIGTVAWCKDAGVRHMDALSLEGVGEKMFAAGQFASRRFSQDHPAEYDSLGYRAVDARHSVLLRFVAPMAGAFARFGARSLDRTHALQWLPYPVSSVVARTIGAMHYLAGTAASRIPM